MAADPRFNYQVKPAVVTSDMVTQQMKSILAEGTSPSGRVFLFLKLVLFSVYWFVIEKTEAHERLIAKQQYEQDEANRNQGEADQADPEKK